MHYVSLENGSSKVTRVSVIIPVWDRPQILYRSLISALTQTHKNLEVLVVGDGCPEEMAQQYRETLRSLKDDRVKFVNMDHHKESSWATSGLWARNFGLERATGDFIAPLDDDDMWLPYHLEIALEILEHADFTHGKWLDVSGPSKTADIRGNENRIGHLTVVYKAKYQSIKYPDTIKAGSDWKLWRAIKANGAQFHFDNRVHGIHYTKSW